MSQTDVLKSLEEAPKVVDEATLDSVIAHQLLGILADTNIMPILKGGNVVIGNEQRGVEKFSLYYKSRPNFMLCTDTLGIVVIAEEEEEECTGPPLLDTVTGFVTENKRETSGDHLGQLLGSMEKLAGDMAASRLRTGGPFTEINVYGLLVNYAKKEAFPYLLMMNFKDRSSALKVGSSKLHLAEAYRRLAHLILRTSDSLGSKTIFKHIGVT